MGGNNVGNVMHGVSHNVKSLIGTIWEILQEPLTYLVRISRNSAVSLMRAACTVN